MEHGISNTGHVKHAKPGSMEHGECSVTSAVCNMDLKREDIWLYWSGTQQFPSPFLAVRRHLRPKKYKSARAVLAKYTISFYRDCGKMRP